MIHLLCEALSRALAITVIAAVRTYQLVVSPWLGPTCRFTPSCSEYARQAVERYGAVGGLRRAAARLLRCHPFHRGGWDPVR